MSLLKTLINEEAAAGSTGAGAVACAPGSLFGGGEISPVGTRTKSKKKPIIRRLPKMFPRLAESLGIADSESRFNASDVISKLEDAEKKAKASHDTVGFGMEDENGNIVKVLVRSEQAEEFEKALAAMLGGSDDNGDDKNTSIEIAEVLFNLKNKFDIVDVDWGQITQDEEEEQEVEGGEEMEQGVEEMPAEDPMAGAVPDEGAATSALQQVIDLLKAQADAQRAEAEAKAAEARAREAEYAAKAAESKIRQEEEILDMETWNKKKSEEKKEAQRLAKLAKFKHETANKAGETLRRGGATAPDTDDDFDMEENEERVVSPRDLAAAIRRQLGNR